MLEIDLVHSHVTQYQWILKFLLCQTQKSDLEKYMFGIFHELSLQLSSGQNWAMFAYVFIYIFKLAEIK